MGYQGYNLSTSRAKREYVFSRVWLTQIPSFMKVFIIIDSKCIPFPENDYPVDGGCTHL
jgi:hypothetical protein